MPSARRRRLLSSLLDTAPATRCFIVPSASMKWLTVEPVPTPTTVPGTTWASAAARPGPSVRLGSSADYRRPPRGENPRHALVPYALTRPFLFGLDPETAHDLTLGAHRAAAEHTRAMPVAAAAHRRPGRAGRAATSPTASAWPRAWTRTAAASTAWARWASASSRWARSRRKAQPGNPKPRMFRLPQANALINRLGFNNDGLEAFVANVQRAQQLPRRRRHRRPEHRQERGHADRARGRRLPDRPGRRVPACRLRDRQHLQPEHQEPARAAERRGAGRAARRAAAAPRCSSQQQHRRQVPMFVKIAPDLDEAQVGVIAATLQRHGIDGVIATNTTVARDARARPAAADEAGGLSGAPVLAQQPRHPPAARRTRQGLPDHRRRRRDERGRRGDQGRGRRRPGADLHRADLPRARRWSRRWRRR